MTTTPPPALQRAAGGLVFVIVLLSVAMVPMLRGVWLARGPWWGHVAFVALLGASYVLLVAGGVRGYRAYVAEDGAHAPGLFGGGETFLAWSDVTRVELFRGVSLHIYAGKRRVALTIFTFREPERLLAFVRERAPHATG